MSPFSFIMGRRFTAAAPSEALAEKSSRFVLNHRLDNALSLTKNALQIERIETLRLSGRACRSRVRLLATTYGMAADRNGHILRKIKMHAACFFCHSRKRLRP
jgi:hypothetical protein